jgi:hypothetical protein
MSTTVWHVNNTAQKTKMIPIAIIMFRIKNGAISVVTKKAPLNWNVFLTTTIKLQDKLKSKISQKALGVSSFEAIVAATEGIQQH